MKYNNKKVNFKTLVEMDEDTFNNGLYIATTIAEIIEDNKTVQLTLKLILEAKDFRDNGGIAK
jgi:hypothetical protein